MLAAALEGLLICVLILANGVFALSEIAVVSARKPRLQQRAEEGDRNAAAALELANSPDRFLSTVQIGITLVGILTGAFSGATIAREIGQWAGAIPWLAPYRSTFALVTVVTLITYVSLVIGELVPKRIALASPERIAAYVARPMVWLSRAAVPLVWLLSASTDLVGRALGIQTTREPSVTEEELTAMLQLGKQTGVLETREFDMVRGVLHLAEQRSAALATARPTMTWLDLKDPPAVIRTKLLERREAECVVCDGGPDRVVGIVHTADLLAHCLAGRALDLRETAQPALLVPDTTSALRLLELFRRHQCRTAILVDPHGGTHGVATLMDVLEAIIGELPSPGDNPSPRVLKEADGSLLVDGLLPISRLKDELGLRTLPRESEGEYDTVGGMMCTRLGRIPAAGDLFEWGGHRFQIAEMAGHRVATVRVRPA